jgi:outer membrane protein assembly factor BamD
MISRQKHILQAMAVAMLATGLSACGTFGRDRRENVQYVEEPVALLYNRGSEYLDRRLWPQALLMFEEVERQHT